MKLRGGRELIVLNLSPVGALLEGDSRLLPGIRTDVHVITRHGRVLVRARVVRAFVCRLRADAVTYQAAISFEATVDTSAHGYALPVDTAVADPERNPYPAAPTI